MLSLAEAYAELAEDFTALLALSAVSPCIGQLPAAESEQFVAAMKVFCARHMPRSPLCVGSTVASALTAVERQCKRIREALLDPLNDPEDIAVEEEVYPLHTWSLWALRGPNAVFPLPF